MKKYTHNKMLLPSLIVLIGLIASYFIYESGKKPPANYKKNKAKRVRLVKTAPLTKGSVVPYWQSSGFVIPAESIKVYGRVSGSIAEINPEAVPGGQLAKGQWLAKLEALDFELALASAQAQLAQAKANYELEQANQTIAKEELSLLNQNNEIGIDEALVLRKPQLTAAIAKVKVAENNVEKAALSLARTTIVMPFDGSIVEKAVGVSSKISSNTLLFSVVSNETYWLEVKLPHKFLPLLDQTKTVDISQSRLWGEGKQRQARFISVLPELDSKDRQVKVLLAIDQPQVSSSQSPAVFINDFLTVTLKGKAINDAWVIQYPWLLPDNSIWVVDKANTLQKRAVEVLFKGRELIYIQADFQQGDLALAEKPGIAAVGMQVRAKRANKNNKNNKKAAQQQKPANQQNNKQLGEKHER